MVFAWYLVEQDAISCFLLLLCLLKNEIYYTYLDLGTADKAVDLLKEENSMLLDLNWQDLSHLIRQL